MNQLDTNDKHYQHAHTRDVRWGRYIEAHKIPHYSKWEFRFSHDGHQWNCLVLTKHELRKLYKIIKQLNLE